MAAILGPIGAAFYEAPESWTASAELLVSRLLGLSTSCCSCGSRLKMWGSKVIQYAGMRANIGLSGQLLS